MVKTEFTTNEKVPFLNQMLRNQRISSRGSFHNPTPGLNRVKMKSCDLMLMMFLKQWKLMRKKRTLMSLILENQAEENYECPLTISLFSISGQGICTPQHSLFFVCAVKGKHSQFYLLFNRTAPLSYPVLILLYLFQLCLYLFS